MSVAVIALAVVKGVEVRCGDGVELVEVVGGSRGIHGAHGFDDLGLICRGAGAG
jgi:hypothetical protein